MTNEYNERAKGGTELSIAELTERIPSSLLDKFAIVPSRFRGLPGGLIPIYWVHDTEDDPEMEHLANGGWKKFAKIIFVSHWQKQRFIKKFGIPWSKCVVVQNAVPVKFEDVNLDLDWSGDTPYRFIYHTTPHRGLDVLYDAFNMIAGDRNVHLDVYSSFSIYGWEGRDAAYQSLFDSIRANPKCTYHGAKSNEEVREALKKTHFFVYPSTWQETGCRSLMEAMCNGVMCAHTDYGCLAETGAGCSYVYPFDENRDALVKTTAAVMHNMIETPSLYTPESNAAVRASVATEALRRYSWDSRVSLWVQTLQGVLNENEGKTW